MVDPGSWCGEPRGVLVPVAAAPVRRRDVQRRCPADVASCRRGYELDRIVHSCRPTHSGFSRQPGGDCNAVDRGSGGIFFERYGRVILRRCRFPPARSTKPDRRVGGREGIAVMVDGSVAPDNRLNSAGSSTGVRRPAVPVHERRRRRWTGLRVRTQQGDRDAGRADAKLKERGQLAA